MPVIGLILNLQLEQNLSNIHKTISKQPIIDKMSQTAGKLENISKQYRLGVAGTGTLSHNLNHRFALVRGNEDPSLKIVNHFK